MLKLQRITDIRRNQIWTLNDGETFDLIDSAYEIGGCTKETIDRRDNCWYTIFLMKDIKDETGAVIMEGDGLSIEVENSVKPSEFLEKGMLVGVLGITHKIKDGVLVDIPARKVEVGDVVDLDGTPCVVLAYSPYDKDGQTIIFDGLKTHEFDRSSYLERIGVLGVDWEIVNDREV